MTERYTEVTIGGRTYQMGGSDDTGYMQMVAEYLNGKIDELTANPGYRRLPEAERNLMLMMNLADDYFQQKKQAERMEKQMEGMEEDIDTLRHDLVRVRLQNEKDNNEIG